MIQRTSIITGVLLIGSLLPGLAAAAEDGEHHPHHVALATGVAWYDSKDAIYLGADYVYSWSKAWGVGAYYEGVSGDFELQVIGLLISRKFQSGWKFNFGPGVERKLVEGKDLLTFRLQTGYDWHSGHWGWGPQFTVDLIEDGNTTYYLGFSVGYGW